MMGNRAVQEISLLLTSRLPAAKQDVEKPRETGGPVHKSWDAVSRASLVILWGLLVYPRLDPDMAKSGMRPVRLARVYDLFREHLGSEQAWIRVLDRLKRHDYIRCPCEETVTAGTRLWTAVDASRMYHLFRTSVLVRQMTSGNSEESPGFEAPAGGKEEQDDE